MTDPSDFHAGRPVPKDSSFELYTWLFMRVSGILLLVLALGHLAIMHLINSVDTIDYDFVANRWSGDWALLWRSYDWLMLFLALLHGLNGLRTILDDYLRPGGWRTVWMSALYSFGLIFLVIGTIVIVTFQPV